MNFNKTLVLFLLINGMILSQNKNDTYYRSILLSLKAGYHTGYDLGYDQGFPDGLVWDASIDVGLSKSVFLGVNIEFWKKDNVTTYPYLTNISITKNFDSFGYRIHVQYRREIFKFMDLYAELGLGGYRISYEFYTDGSKNADDNSYLNAGISFGAGIKITKFLYLSAEVSHYRLMNFLTEGSGVYTTNFKFGPTFYLQLK